MSTAKLEREPNALTPEYHKARKQLMLWAAILFVWELVGIDLEKAKEAGGNAAAVITAIKSPQAVPWVLLILVGYFVFKVTVEWKQCSQRRRDLTVARIDFTSALLVAAIAYLLYFVQIISRIQFADYIQANKSVAWATSNGLFAGLLLLLSVNRYREGNREWIFDFGLALIVFVAGMFRDGRRVVIASLVAMLVFGGLLQIVREWIRPKTPTTKTV